MTNTIGAISSANADAENGDGNDQLQGKADRDIPRLNTVKKKNNISKLVFAGVALIAIMCMAVGVIFFVKQLEQNKREQVVAQSKVKPKEEAPAQKDFGTAKNRIKQQEAAQLPPPASASTASASTEAGSGATANETANADTSKHSVHDRKDAGVSGQHDAKPVETPAQRRLSGSVQVDLGAEAGKGFTGRSSNGGNTGNAVLGASVASAPKNGFDDKLKPSQLLAGQAAQRPDLSFLMRRSTSIPCGQKTKIVTTHPGMVACQVSRDIYSANGDILLVPRGSDVFGEQRTAMMQGQAAIEVLWSRIDTPGGVVIDINSLATDPLGASGIPADVDNHIMQRFGGSVMLSLIGDFGQALANRSSSSGGEIKLNSTANAGQDIAAKALDNTINIPPTAYSMQGAAINIFVARDMDFRTVYELARF